MTEPYYTVESLGPDTSVGFLIKRCGILMTQIAEREFDSQPISFTQWMILMWLTQRPHASPTELSAHLGHDMGALTRVVDELEHDALVRRERSQHDRRAVQIAVTPEGRRVAHAGRRLIVDLLNELVEPYSRAEIDSLISLLQRFLARIQEKTKSTAPAQPAGVASVRRGKRKATHASEGGARKTDGEPRRKSLE